MDLNFANPIGFSGFSTSRIIVAPNNLDTQQTGNSTNVASISTAVQAAATTIATLLPLAFIS